MSLTILRPDRAALIPALAALLPSGWTVFAEWKQTPKVAAWVRANRGNDPYPVVFPGNLDSLVREAVRQELAESRIGPSEWFTVPLPADANKNHRVDCVSSIRGWLKANQIEGVEVYRDESDSVIVRAK